MVSLYLRASREDDGSQEEAKGRREWLDAIETVLKRVLGGEFRMWLITSLSSLDVPSHVQADCFLSLLSNSMPVAGRHREAQYGSFELQLLRMICANRPRLVTSLIAYDHELLERFFKGRPKRILQWFDNFAGAGQTEHQQGARALARYAFSRRDKCWHLLSWKGKHAQAPATVAAKPHYFLELDVVDTVSNFLEYEPDFWWSDEFQESMKDGEFLSLGINFFAEELLKMMSDDMNQKAGVWKVIKDYFAEESFPVLCQQLLHATLDKNLLQFLNDLGSSLPHTYERSRTCGGYKNQTESDKRSCFPKRKSWMELLVFSGVEWESLEEAMISNACVSHGRNLLRLFQDEELEEEGIDSKQLMTRRVEHEGREHWALRDLASKLRKSSACKFLALESWVLLYRLLVEPTEMTVFEALLVESGIEYRRCSTSSDIEVDGKHKKRKWRSEKYEKGSKHRKQGKVSFGDKATRGGSGLNIEQSTWRLLVDDYTLTWTKADLAEYLTSHAVEEWLTCLFGKAGR